MPPQVARPTPRRRVPWWRRDGWPHTVLHIGKIIAPYVVGVAVAIAAIAGVMWRPETVSSAHRADYVVIAGAAGLRWDDINPTDTPTLWAMAGRDSIAALSVRSAHTPTCPPDGWLTLGAGNFARYSGGHVDGACPTVVPTVTSPDGITAVVDGQAVRAGANKALNGAELGALPDAVRCTVAFGPDAALGAARPYGRVDRYAPAFTGRTAPMLGACTLSMVDLGTVAGPTPDERARQARAVDATLARVLADRPPDSLVLVAGLAQTYDSSRLHVAIADGPGYDGGWLTSTSTGREGYLELVDLAPTALAALGQPIPTKLFAGSQAQRVGDRPADPSAAIAQLADADSEASLQHRVAGWFFTVLVLGELALLIGCIPVLRRARRSTEPGGEPASPRLVRRVEALLIAASLTIVVALLTDVVPWWRSSAPGLVFTLIGAVVAGAAVTLVLSEPWRRLSARPRRPSTGGVLGPLTTVSAMIVAVLGVDVLTGSHLQLNGVAGYSAAEGTRYAGIGAVGLGAFIVGVLMLSACLAQLVPDRRWRPFVVAAVGAVGVILAGSPQLGADAGGALALTIGVCVAAAISSGGWLTFTRLGWATLAGLVVLIGFAVLDLRRPVAHRGAVGTMLTRVHNGTAGHALHEAAVSDVTATLTNPLSLLVLVAILYTLLVLVRPWGGLMRLFGLYPAVRGAMTGIGIAATVAGLLDGVGFTTAGAAVSVALPLVTLAALRVLDHADDRTVGRLPIEDLAPDPHDTPDPHEAADPVMESLDTEVREATGSAGRP
jgi:hypothetical protein